MNEIGVYAIVARPGGGKSLFMAWIIRKLLTKEYPTRRHRYPKLPEREVITNSHIFPPSNIYNPDIKYWVEMPDLKFCTRHKCFKGEEKHYIHDSDIFIDEISNLIPAEDWAMTPPWLRDLFSQHRKRGNRIFCCGQSYKGFFNIHVRRMTRAIYMPYIILKSRDITASMPEPRFIHGLVMVPQYDPIQVESLFAGENDLDQLEEVRPMFTVPIFFLMTRSLVSWYATTQEFPRTYAQKMEEFIQECVEGDKCKDPKHRYKIQHRPI